MTPSQIPFCEQFDLTTRISAKALETADTTLIDSGELLRNGKADSSTSDDDSEDEDDEEKSERAARQPDQYRNVLNKIRETLIEGGFSTTLIKDPSAAPSAPAPGAAGLAERHICRIGINSIASPGWRSKTPQVGQYSLCNMTASNPLILPFFYFYLLLTGPLQILACSSWTSSVQFWSCGDHDPRTSLRKQ